MLAHDLTRESSHRYGAFAGAVKRADVSAQSSGAKVLEGLAHIATQESLLLRNSPDLRYASAVDSVKLPKGNLLTGFSLAVGGSSLLL